jgi:hypothetical protein
MFRRGVMFSLRGGYTVINITTQRRTIYVAGSQLLCMRWSNENLLQLQHKASAVIVGRIVTMHEALMQSQTRGSR